MHKTPNKAMITFLHSVVIDESRFSTSNIKSRGILETILAHKLKDRISEERPLIAKGLFTESVDTTKATRNKGVWDTAITFTESSDVMTAQKAFRAKMGGPSSQILDTVLDIRDRKKLIVTMYAESDKDAIKEAGYILKRVSLSESFEIVDSGKATVFHVVVGFNQDGASRGDHAIDAWGVVNDLIDRRMYDGLLSIEPLHRATTTITITAEARNQKAAESKIRGILQKELPKYILQESRILEEAWHIDRTRKSDNLVVLVSFDTTDQAKRAVLELKKQLNSIVLTNVYLETAGVVGMDIAEKSPRTAKQQAEWFLKKLSKGLQESATIMESATIISTEPGQVYDVSVDFGDSKKAESAHKILTRMAGTRSSITDVLTDRTSKTKGQVLIIVVLGIDEREANAQANYYLKKLPKNLTESSSILSEMSTGVIHGSVYFKSDKEANNFKKDNQQKTLSLNMTKPQAGRITFSVATKDAVHMKALVKKHGGYIEPKVIKDNIKAFDRKLRKDNSNPRDITFEFKNAGIAQKFMDTVSMIGRKDIVTMNASVAGMHMAIVSGSGVGDKKFVDQLRKAGKKMGGTILEGHNIICGDFLSESLPDIAASDSAYTVVYEDGVFPLDSEDALILMDAYNHPVMDERSKMTLDENLGRGIRGINEAIMFSEGLISEAQAEFTLVAIKNNKVVGQFNNAVKKEWEDVRDVIRIEYPGAVISVENKSGKIVKVYK